MILDTYRCRSVGLRPVGNPDDRNTGRSRQYSDTCVHSHRWKPDIHRHLKQHRHTRVRRITSLKMEREREMCVAPHTVAAASVWAEPVSCWAVALVTSGVVGAVLLTAGALFSTLVNVCQTQQAGQQNLWPNAGINSTKKINKRFSWNNKCVLI